MNTLYLSAKDAATPSVAAELIKGGELVAIPTETVYGLGADGLNPEAVAKIFRAKGRPQDNPLILHIAEAADMEKFCHHIPDTAYRLAEAFWPGPLTMVLPAKDIVPKCTTAGLPTVAVRCPDNAVTREIIRLAGVPIAAPSANISGKPSTTTAQHVYDDHNGKIPLIVDGGPCRVGVAHGGGCRAARSCHSARGADPCALHGEYACQDRQRHHRHGGLYGGKGASAA